MVRCSKIGSVSSVVTASPPPQLHSPTTSLTAGPVFAASFQKSFCFLKLQGFLSCVVGLCLGFFFFLIIIYLRFNKTVENFKWTAQSPSNCYYWQMCVLGVHITAAGWSKQLGGPRRAHRSIPLLFAGSEP